MAVAAGEYFSLVLTADGEIFSFGRGDKGQLGHRKTNLVGYRALIPRKVEGALAFQKVVKIACGHDHSMAISGRHMLHTFANLIIQCCAHISQFFLQQPRVNCIYGDRTLITNSVSTNQSLPRPRR